MKCSSSRLWQARPVTAATLPVQALSSANSSFAGSQTCRGCHRLEFDRWNGSHHQLAMQLASPATVRGDFNYAVFRNRGVTSTFFMRNRRFMVRTGGPGGELHDYEISFTFGVFPLQQYLIAMPGGRLQALGIAWDSRPRDAGGQRWFFLHPNQEIKPSSPLHWTGIDQTWNYMCADCHSTNLRKNYNLATRTYKTTYAEIDVGCEACHGPGSNHLRWARKTGDWHQFDSNKGLTIALDERRGAAWITGPATGQPQRTAPRTTEREIQMCARCHSRRGQIAEDYVNGQPAGDDYRIALLEDNLYFPDGQIKDEVYEFGSFVQSRMYAAGVTCSDCHEPHSLKLRAEGNKVCLQCHTAKYDSSRHHFHPPGSPGAQCVNCHMPLRTYMVVDARRDHSIRIPRPDLSAKLGVPDACNNCHSNRSAQWASAAIHKWYGAAPAGFQRFADPLQAGREAAPGARAALAALVEDKTQPAIARATALSLLAPQSGDSILRGAEDPSPLVRRAAAHCLSAPALQSSTQVATMLLNDPVRDVRIEAAERLAAPAAEPASPPASALARATLEYVAAQQLNADRPEAHLNLGALFARQGQPDRAQAEFRTALSLDPTFAPAAVNLADLDRQLGRDADGEAVLRSALASAPNDPALLHALGLLMVRKQQISQALELLGSAARLAPANARYAYVYAVALNATGNNQKALEVLQASIAQHPYDRASLSALTNFLDEAGDSSKALEFKQRIAEIDHEDQISLPPD